MMSRLATWDGTAEHVSRDQILRRERGQGNINVPCSADHEQDWQPYPVDPYSCYIICVTIHTYILHTVALIVELGQQCSIQYRGEIYTLSSYHKLALYCHHMRPENSSTSTSISVLFML